jgi:hypothetical protein
MRLKSESKVNSRKGSETDLVSAITGPEAGVGTVDVGDIEKGLRGPMGTEGVPVVGGGVEERLGMIEEIKREGDHQEGLVEAELTDRK